MIRKSEKSKFNEPLSETVQKLVDQFGGWLNVFSRVTNSFDRALVNLGKTVDCSGQLIPDTTLSFFSA